MSDTAYTIRNYRPADFDSYVLLNIEAEKLEPAGWCLCPQVVAENLGRPNYSPEQDLFIVETSGSIVGYLDVTLERAIGWVILNCWIHPEHRRRGLATKLLAKAMHRAQELGVKVAHINVPEANAAVQGLLSRLGFKSVRRHLELRLDTAKLGGQDTDRAAPGCGHLKPGEEDKLTRIQNRSFAGTWGYNLNTVEEIAYRINLSHSSPEDIVLACDDGTVTGYCWTGVTGKGESAADGRKGRIFMLGVDPDYRGRGVGKRVLLAGLAYLKGKGMRVVELTVDTENKAALALYRAVGFDVRESSLWYEKAVDEGRGAE